MPCLSPAASSLWAAALAGIGAVSSTIGALVLLAAAGAGRTVLDVAGRTLLQRLAQPEALGRVFGLLESVSMAGLAVGSVIAPVFVALAGGGGAFVCLALLLPLSMLLVFRSLLAADQAVLPIVEMARLRALPFFAPLAAPELEMLARALEPLEVPEGTAVIREGEPGDLLLRRRGRRGRGHGGRRAREAARTGRLLRRDRA